MSAVAKLTLEHYNRMIDAGVFDGLRHRRLEFIAGELREMSPIGRLHAHAMDVLTQWSAETVHRDQAIIRIQGPLEIAELESVPEPDVLWLAVRPYWPEPATPSDVLLLIEVADTSLDYDRGEKAELYAEAGIEDYWIVNIPDRCIEVHRNPHHGRYRSLQTYEVGKQVRPLKFPDAVLEVASPFPAE